VDGRLVGVIKEPGQVEHAALVFDVGFLAIENQTPDAAVFAQGVAGRRERICGLMDWWLVGLGRTGRRVPRVVSSGLGCRWGPG
jgi:hypothetical protein